MSETITAVDAKKPDNTAAAALNTRQKVVTTYVDEPYVSLTLSPAQAGYLIDILAAHVSGEVATFLRPVRIALRQVVDRRYATNTGYNIAKLRFETDEARKEATGKSQLEF